MCYMTFVSDASGGHIVDAYSSIGLVMALFVASIVLNWRCVYVLFLHVV